MGILWKFWGWLIGSRTGQMILIALVVAFVLRLYVKQIKHDAYNQGMAVCQAAYEKAQLKADQEQAAREATQRARASEITKTTTQQASTAIAKTDAATATTREVIRNVYRDRPVPVPGQCNHPLDDRLQQRFNQAVETANRP